MKKVFEIVVRFGKNLINPKVESLMLFEHLEDAVKALNQLEPYALESFEFVEEHSMDNLCVVNEWVELDYTGKVIKTFWLAERPEEKYDEEKDEFIRETNWEWDRKGNVIDFKASDANMMVEAYIRERKMME